MALALVISILWLLRSSRNVSVAEVGTVAELLTASGSTFCEITATTKTHISPVPRLAGGRQGCGGVGGGWVAEMVRVGAAAEA